ncbi:MAG: glycosyltransferase family 2 protein [Elusimicrobia bacterium]|nr:glycosyltransferase family 2 protein [Elusimicrobiota bacterium]
MLKGLKISLVMPCLNEESGIRKMLEQVPGFIDETIVVDGGSRDKTAEIAQDMGARVIVERRRGYGLAHKRGFEAAQGDIIVAADGDSTYPVGAASEIVDYMIERRLDFVSAARFPLRQETSMRYRNFIGNVVITLILNILFKAKLTDGLSGMWVFKKNVLSKMKFLSDNWNFSEEIKIEAVLNTGINFAEFPIVYAERLGETKLFPWTVGVENIFFLFYKRLLTL